MSGRESYYTWRSAWNVHSSQARDLLGGNGRSRVLQYAPEMFVADLVLREKGNVRAEVEQRRPGKQDKKI
jgi:hypothetical protein